MIVVDSIVMILCESAAAKRCRGEDDNDEDGYRPLTPDSCADKPVECMLPLSKKHRFAGDSLECCLDNGRDADETMTDVSERSESQFLDAGLLSPVELDHHFDDTTRSTQASVGAHTLIELECKGYSIEVDQIFWSRDARYTTPGMAYSDVRVCIDAIANCVGPGSSYNAKTDALEVLQDISLSILRADRPRQATETKARFAQDDCIPQLMLKIVQSMSGEERLRATGEATAQGSTLERSVQYVHEKAV